MSPLYSHIAQGKAPKMNFLVLLRVQMAELEGEAGSSSNPPGRE